MLMGSQGAQATDALLKDSRDSAQGILATVVGFITLLFSASGVMIKLRDALNTIWEIPVAKIAGVRSKIYAYTRERLLSFTMVLSVGFLLVVSLTVSSWIAALGSFSSSILPRTGCFCTLVTPLPPAGDVASVNAKRIEHWRVAQQHRRRAALGMLGHDVGDRSVPFFWTYHFENDWATWAMLRTGMMSSTKAVPRTMSSYLLSEGARGQGNFKLRL